MEYSADRLNLALGLSTEWGENFRKPIDSRMLERFPGITPVEMEELKEVAKEAETYIYDLAEQEMAGTIAEHDIVRLALQRFPWIAPDQASRLKNIGIYYARR